MSVSMFPEIVPSKYDILFVDGLFAGRRFITDSHRVARRARYLGAVVTPDPPDWSWGEEIGLRPATILVMP